MQVRGRWDWLCELVRRQPTGAASPSPALVDAIAWLGLSPDQIVDAIAAVLDVARDRVRDPDPASAAKVDGDRLALLLPALLRHDDAMVRAIAKRWLSLPAAAYAIPASTLETWLDGDGGVVDELAPRLRDEGLALLGPERLRRIARAARRASVRTAARRWVDHLGG